MNFVSEYKPDWYCLRHKDPFPIMCSNGEVINDICKTCEIARDYSRWKAGFYDDWREMPIGDLLSIKIKTQRKLEGLKNDEQQKEETPRPNKPTGNVQLLW